MAISVSKDLCFTVGIILGVLWITIVFGIAGVFHRPTPISERITSCEEKGGKYNYIWNNIGDYYLERCEITNSVIKDF